MDDIHSLLPYHVLHGLHISLSVNSTQFIPTLLDNSTYANVTGRSQPDIRRQHNLLLRRKVPSTIMTPDILLTKGFLHIVDAVLQVPLPLSQTVSLANPPYFKGLLQQGGAFSGQALSQTVEVELLTNVTYFGVNSLEFELNYTGFQNLTRAEILNLASYVVLNGTVAYSTLFTDGATFQTQQGGNVTVTVASDGTTYLNYAMVI
jgi:uncharacterized surface protein with fasciclin (FAS1) repeats